MLTEERIAATALEGMLDKLGLPAVVSLLAEVCQEKAEHLRSNWQDEGSAREWERKSKLCDKLGFKLIP